MAIVRRRYYFWLARAYLRRWYKTILSSLFAGVIIFFVIGFIINFYLLPMLQKKVHKIGYVGAYTTQNIPNQLLSDVSFGLVKVSFDGSINTAASSNWEIKNGGKEYVFHLKKGQKFQDGQELTSQTLPISFKDSKRTNIDKYTVSFKLKSAYSPFLVSVSRPMLLPNLAGLGEYRIKKVEINGGYVKSLTLISTKSSLSRKTIVFYPTQEALKDAYALGDIDTAKGVLNTTIKGSDIAKWSNTSVKKIIDYQQLITIFYNNEDKFLSNKRVRQALSYAIPSKLRYGERAYSPIPPSSIYFSQSPNFGISDLEISKSLIKDESDLKKTTLELTTTDEFLNVAEDVAVYWKMIGIKTKIKIVSELPRSFQILIYPIKLPTDPDQYTLWHSAQLDNITHYKNLRIDKLLEDGRSISEKDKRIPIYSDFQKYLIDDAPATFLYFPINYNLSRK